MRSKDSRTAQLEKLGAELVVADLYDADQLTDAARGTQRAFYLPPFRPHMLQSAVAFAVAARAAKLEHVVQLSQWTPHRLHKAHMTRQTWLADQLFAMIPGVAHTVLNPGMFAHNFLRVIDFAALLAIYPVLAPKGKAAPVSNEDIARVAAVLLAEGPGLHAGKTYRLTGPALLDSREMAAIVAKAVGHGVMRINMPIWMLGKVARQQGVDPFEISSIRFYMQDMAEGTFEFEGGVTNVVEELTGTPAESFEITARRCLLPGRLSKTASRHSSTSTWCHFMRAPNSTDGTSAWPFCQRLYRAYRSRTKIGTASTPRKWQSTAKSRVRPEFSCAPSDFLIPRKTGGAPPVRRCSMPAFTSLLSILSVFFKE